MTEWVFHTAMFCLQTCGSGCGPDRYSYIIPDTWWTNILLWKIKTLSFLAFVPPIMLRLLHFSLWLVSFDSRSTASQAFQPTGVHWDQVESPLRNSIRLASNDLTMPWKSSLLHFLNNWRYAKPLPKMLVSRLIESNQFKSPLKDFHLHSIEDLLILLRRWLLDA